MPESKPAVRIECEGALSVDIADLIPFQGELKTLDEINYNKLKEEILADGFSEPISVWKREEFGPQGDAVIALYILNGHQRLRTLRRMRDEGHEVPLIPISIVHAPDERTAKRKVLALTSQYGQMTPDSLVAYMKESNLTFREVSTTMRFPEVDFQAIELKFNTAPTGGGEGGTNSEPPVTEPPPSTLADRFLVPPFSVLDARQGYWQGRKQQWLALGIKSELGRGASMPAETLSADGGNIEAIIPHYYEKLKAGRTREQIIEDYMVRCAKRAVPGGGSGSAKSAYYMGGGKQGGYKNQEQHVDGVLMKSDSGNDPQYYFKKQQVERELGRELTTEEFQRDFYQGPDTYQSGTSIFDPVLCEIAYRWFCPKGGRVLDPFAGGSVRGIVASHCELDYTGVELRPEQVQANRAQTSLARAEHPPEWLCDDSAFLVPRMEPYLHDLIFSCPPYADLEVYSDDPCDLSNMPWEKFLELYRKIIAESVRTLKTDRFAVWIIGEVRDRKTGSYRNLVGETVRAFIDAGANFYNEAILVTQLGSLPIRAGRQFAGSRALGKTHQNVLVFVKGDRHAATKACGEVSIPDFLLPKVDDNATNNTP